MLIMSAVRRLLIFVRVITERHMMRLFSTGLLAATFLLVSQVMAAPDFSTAWSTLGLKRNATAAEIKTAYRSLAKQYSPDIPSTSKENAALFPYITAAKDVLSDSKTAPIYERYLTVVDAGVLRALDWKELSVFTTSKWQMFSAEISQAEEAAAAEERYRNPPVEDVIDFSHVLNGSIAEERLMKAYTEAAKELGQEFRTRIGEKSIKDLNELKLIWLRRGLAKKALAWTADLPFVIEDQPSHSGAKPKPAKSLKFSDKFTELLFRQHIQHRLVRLVFHSAAERLNNYSYQDGNSVFSAHFRNYLDQLTDSRLQELAVFISLYRRASKNLWMRDAAEYELIKVEPAKWAAAASSAQAYVFNRLSQSPERDQFVKFLNRLSIPWKDVKTETTLQKVAAVTTIGARCAAFAMKGGFSPIEGLRASLKRKSESKK